MQFIVPFVKTNAPDSDSQGNIPSPVARDSENLESENESESENTEIQTEIAVEDTEPDITDQREPMLRTEGTKKTARNTAKKRKLEVRDPDKAFVEFCESRKNRDESKDPNKMFLLSLVPDVNQMNPQQTRRFKRDVLCLIDNILDNTSSGTTSNANHGQSGTFYTSTGPSTSSSHDYNINSWMHGSSDNEWSSRSTSATPLTSPTGIQVENRWPNHTSTSHSQGFQNSTGNQF